MIADLDGLRPLERRFADQLKRYLEAKGVDQARYWIGPADQAAPLGVDVVARHEAVLDANGNTRTTLHLPFAGEMPPLVAGFSDVTTLMMHLLGEPAAWEALHGLNVSGSDEQVLAWLGVDWGHVYRPAVKAWAEGSFLAPDGDGYTYFLVEPRGALTVIATSAALVPVAWAYAADRHIEQSNLAGRIAMAAPIR